MMNIERGPVLAPHVENRATDKVVIKLKKRMVNAASMSHNWKIGVAVHAKSAKLLMSKIEKCYYLELLKRA